MEDGAGPDERGDTAESEHETETPPAATEEGDFDEAGAAQAGVLAVVCGLPGVGKSTVAGRLAERLDADVLRTDVVRKELFDEPTYTDEEIETVYREVFDRARRALRAGDNVVLDATFVNREWREAARAVATEHGRVFHLFAVECPESVVKRRIERRDGVSDADFETHRELKATFDPIELDHVVIDNSGSEAETLAQIDEQF
jgi:hypothetical protein